MPVPLRATITPAALDRDGVSAAQTTGGATDLTIAGDLASGGVVTFDIPRRVGIYSSGNLSGVTFTVYGTDRMGLDASESVTGPNNSTVETTKNFLKVTRVAVSGAVGTNVEVGTTGTFDLSWIPLNYRSEQFGATVAVAPSSGSSFTYSIQYTNDNVLELGEGGVLKVWDSPVTDATDADEAAFTSPTMAVRVAVSSYASGSLTFYVLQQ